MNPNDSQAIPELFSKGKLKARKSKTVMFEKADLIETIPAMKTKRNPGKMISII